MLVAAEKAPSVFNIAAYFRAIYVMRQKGYSWRQLESWVHEFGVEISAVHLRRLYVQENARLTEMSAEGLAAQGCPEDMIDDLLSKNDPTGRLTAVDPEDAALIRARRKMLMDSGVTAEELEGADLHSYPVKLIVSHSQ